MPAAATPPQANNVPPAGKAPLIPPDERFWKRYSPHFEAPLSAVSSFAVHALAFLVLLLGVFLVARLGLGRNTDPLPVQPIQIVGGGGGHKHGIGKDPGDGIDPREVGARNPDEDGKIIAPEVPLDKLPPVKVAPNQLPELQKTVEGKRIVAQGTQALAGLVKLDEKARKDMMEGLVAGKGEGGPGQDGGKDKGRDKGQGEGIGEGTDGKMLNERTKRVLRWTMMFNTADGNDYLRQLAALDAFVAVPEGNGQYRVYRNLSKRPCTGEVEDLKEIQRIFWVDDKPESVRSLAIAMQLPDVPQHIVAFFPVKLEKELLRKELNFRGRKEHEIHETRFQVVRRGGTYVAEVVDQTAARP